MKGHDYRIVVGYWLLVAGGWWLVAGGWWLVVSYWLLVLGDRRRALLLGGFRLGLELGCQPLGFGKLAGLEFLGDQTKQNGPVAHIHQSCAVDKNTRRDAGGPERREPRDVYRALAMT
jgi:hypothetical protein